MLWVRPRLRAACACPVRARVVAEFELGQWCNLQAPPKGPAAPTVVQVGATSTAADPGLTRDRLGGYRPGSCWLCHGQRRRLTACFRSQVAPADTPHAATATIMPTSPTPHGAAPSTAAYTRLTPISETASTLDWKGPSAGRPPGQRPASCRSTAATVPRAPASTTSGTLSMLTSRPVQA